VAVDRDDGLLDVGHVLTDAFNQLAEFLGHAVADRVRDVDGFGPGPDGCFKNLVEKFGIGAGGVHGGELHIVDEGFGIGHHLLGNLQHLSAGFAQLIFEVDVRGGDEGMDAGLGSRLEGFSCRFNISLAGTSQAADDGAIGGAHVFRYLLHRLKVAGAGVGKPRLNDVDP